MKLSVAVIAALLLVFTSSPAHALWPFVEKTTDDTAMETPAAPESAIVVPKNVTIPAPAATTAVTPTAKVVVPNKLPELPSFTNTAPLTNSTVTTTLPAVTTMAPAAKPAFVIPTKPTPPAVPATTIATPVAPTAPVKPATTTLATPATQTVVAPVKTLSDTEKAAAEKAALDAAKAKTQAILDQQAKENAAKAKDMADKDAAAKAVQAQKDAELAKQQTERDKANAERLKSEKDLADKEKAALDAAKAAALKKEEEQKKKDAASIAGHLESKGEFKTLIKLLQLASITTLKSPGNFTIFAPTDAAFAKFTDIKLSELEKPENIDTLKTLLSYHMLNGNFLMKNIAGRKGAPNALQGDELKIDATSEPVHVGKAKVLDTDTGATNGTIYYLDEVLMPPSLAASLAAEAAAKK